jgi:hypothetical protein
MSPKTPKGALYKRTLELLAERSRSVTLRAISEETGLPEPWLKLVSRDQIADPSVNRVETLYAYLNGKPLNV